MHRLPGSARKRAHDEDQLASPSSQKRLRVTEWLYATELAGGPISHKFRRRASSAPERFTEHLKTSHSPGQLFFLNKPDDDMEPSEEAAEDATDATDAKDATKKPRRAVSASADYTKTLLEHGIGISGKYRKYPEELKAFLTKEIFKDVKSLVSEQEFERVLHTRDKVNFSNETCVSAIYHTPMFPVLLDGLAEEGETVWDTTALQCERDHGEDKCPVIAPKSDFYLGYDYTTDGPFNRSETSLMNLGISRPYTTPSKKLYFPYLVVELKSDPAGGNLAKAEAQAATTAALCVKGLRWMLKAANMPESLEAVEKTIAFSVCMNHRSVALYVHWYTGGDDPQVCMTQIDEFLTCKIEGVRECAAALENIHNWAMGDRKKMISLMLNAMVKNPPSILSRKRPGSNDQSGPISKKPKRSSASGSGRSNAAKSPALPSESGMSQVKSDLSNSVKSEPSPGISQRYGPKSPPPKPAEFAPSTKIGSAVSRLPGSKSTPTKPPSPPKSVS